MTTSLRSDTAQLVRLADRDLTRLWALVANGAAADEALHDLLPAIVREYGAVGGAMAAEWYDQQREKVGAKGRFAALPVEADDRGTQSLIGWALNTATDGASLQSLVLGGVQRRIANHARLTITQSSLADPAAQGWSREGSGDCDFCSMLVNRGAVYTEATADFASHDNCNCAAVPAFDGEPRPVKAYKSPLTEVSAGSRPPPAAPPTTAQDEPLSPMERMARALTANELRMETRRGSARAREMAYAELKRRGLPAK